ncbi:hypothetical protein BC629DRAFT_1550159, partial [Irpex lacteus]
MSTFPPVLSSLVCVLAPRGLWPFLVLRVPPLQPCMCDVVCVHVILPFVGDVPTEAFFSRDERGPLRGPRDKYPPL